MSRKTDDVTRLLGEWTDGNSDARDELMPLIYEELRRIAGSRLRRERPDHTLQVTALVNEAYIRLVDQARVEWRNRAHFFAIAARVIRRILVDYARRRSAGKRGGDRVRVTFDEQLEVAHQRELDLLVLDDALDQLAAVDPDLAGLVDLRFFGGLTIEETAEALAVSPSTVKREWATARAWLQREISGGHGEP